MAEALQTLTREELQLRERRRRRYELLAAAALIVIMVLATWGQLSWFGADSWLFMALLNINIILMLVVLFLVTRNVIKLLVERRRKVFGARLRTRLVLAFVSLALVPIVAMFFAANRVVATSVDYWFTTQVENSMQAALEVGQSFYNAAASRLRDNSLLFLNEITSRNIALGSPEMDALMERRQKEAGLTLVGFVRRKEGNPPTYAEENWHSLPAFQNTWNRIRSTVNWEQVSLSGFDSQLWADVSGDYVISVLPVRPGDSVYLVSAEAIGRGLLNQLDRISQGFEEYSQLKSLKRPLKLSFTLILALLGLIMIFGAIWVAFRLSRQLTEPIHELSRGTAQMARGDLDFQLEDSGRDELGQLVESFNHMAREVKDSREHLTRLNALLEDRSQTLEERNLYIEAVLEHIAAGVITLDPQGRILTMNKAAGAIFGATPAQWLGRDPSLILSPEHLKMFSQMFVYLRRHPDGIWQHGLEFVRKNRHWKLMVHAVALPAAGTQNGAEEQNSVVAVIEDITELARMQRFAAWREVAQRIAHEIKNPLTPIKLSAQRLEKKFSASIEDPAFTQSTHLIVKEVERMQNMVKEFSAFASLPEVELELGEVDSILDETVALFRNSHPGIAWELAKSGPLPALRRDPEALHRALMNILGNAAEALEHTPGGKVILRASVEAETLTLEIEDNGPGLTEEENARLFEPYFSRKSGGTGLGLAIVRSIIGDHNASVSATSLPGGGTRIRMDFPLTQRLG